MFYKIHQFHGNSCSSTIPGIVSTLYKESKGWLVATIGGGLWHLPLQHSGTMSVTSCDCRESNFPVLHQVHPAHCILYSMSLKNQ